MEKRRREWRSYGLAYNSTVTAHCRGTTVGWGRGEREKRDLGLGRGRGDEKKAEQGKRPTSLRPPPQPSNIYSHPTSSPTQLLPAAHPGHPT